MPTSLDMTTFQSQYDRYITSCIQRLSRRPVSRPDLDDLKQQVLLRVLDTRYTYDPTRAQVTTYLYYVIRTVVFAVHKRRETDPLTHTADAEWLEPDEPAALDRAPTRPEDLIASRAAERARLALDFNTRFEAYLETVPVHRPQYRGLITLPDGDRRPQGFAVVFHLLRQEYTPTEIAEVVGMTTSNVCYYIKRIHQEAHQFATTAQKSVASV